MVSWDATDCEYNKLHQSLGLRRPCSCTWTSACKKAQAIFALSRKSNQNDPRGTQCVELNLSGSKQKKVKWRTVVLKNLGLKEEPKNLHVVPVAPHHWTVDQIEYRDDKQFKPSTTYLSKEDVDRVGYVTDKFGSFEDEKGNRQYFMVPNNPKSCWEADAKLLLGDRTVRVEQRTDSAKKAEQSKCQKERKKEIETEKEEKRWLKIRDDTKSPWEWRKEAKDLSDTIKYQEGELNDKDSKIQGLEEELKKAKYQLLLSRQKICRFKSKSPPQRGGTSYELECDCNNHFLREVSKLIVQQGGAS